ncbi:hypothetical protein EXS57_02970 [Candidatus Kaiserbacteria bacterium]|nr:hypothetical protein [Candidatus Kaiserbacteria bacterium]
MPQQQSYIVAILVFLGALTVGAGLLYFYFNEGFGPVRTSALPELVQDVRSGDFEEASVKLLSIQGDANKSADEKALALYASLGTQYRLTGDPKARLIDIRNMKPAILDATVSGKVRVNILNALAGQYSISGGDTAVFMEIYKDAPFDQYLVKGDPNLSARKLYEWSYSLLPTSSAAIGIARWYTEQVILNRDQPRTITTEYAATAEGWLNKADAATEQEAKNDPTYGDSTRYLVYRYWRAVIIGRLSVQKGEPYLSDYRTEFENFFTFAKGQQNILAEEYILYGHLFYAQLLVRNDDRTTAKAQADLLATALNDVSNPGTSVFISFLKYESSRNGATWSGISSLFTVSPSFKEAVDKVLATQVE